MSHLVKQILRYGALQQNSAERYEHGYKMKFRDGWNASNHTLNYPSQVITFQHRILCFEVRELNLQALLSISTAAQPHATSSLSELIWLHP
jgi:hypothetical protein